MKKTLTALALTGALAAPAWATSSHGTAHSEAVLHADAMAIGYPGNPVLADRTIRVAMLDESGGAMAFDPNDLDIEAGETIRIVLTNEGSVAHEFVMATPAEIADDREEMRGIADMPHDAAFAARVDPGQSKSLIWTFANEGSFEIACLIPGHVEAGMRGRLTVS